MKIEQKGLFGDPNPQKPASTATKATAYKNPPNTTILGGLNQATLQAESVYMLRDSIGEMMDVVADEPEILEEPDCMTDFIAALAMRKALEVHGILYDA